MRLNHSNQKDKMKLITSFVGIIILLSGCKKNDQSFGGPNSQPVTIVTTISDSSITNFNALLGGQITNNTDTTPLVERGIQYGTTATSDTSRIASSDTTNQFGVLLPNLQPNTLYYAKAYIKNKKAVFYYGNQVSFTTRKLDSTAMIYVSGGRTSDLFAINPLDGKIKWQVKLNSNACTSPIYTNGKVVTGGSDNKLYAFDTTGKLSWTIQLSGRLFAGSSPIVNNGIIYVTDNINIYSINSIDGSIIWQYSKKNGSLASITAGQLIINNNTIYCNEGLLYAVDATTGREKWNFSTGSTFTPVVYGDRIYYMSSGPCYVDTATGQKVWRGGNWDYYTEPYSINIRYGYIYAMIGGVRSGMSVTDSATATVAKYYLYGDGSVQPDGRSPMLLDNFAITASGVYDALTGSLLARLPAYSSRSGLTYAGGIVYYASTERPITNTYTGATNYYGDIYAQDTRTQTRLWVNTVLNMNFFGIEPCVVTKSGTVYRGEFTYH